MGNYLYKARAQTDMGVRIPSLRSIAKMPRGAPAAKPGTEDARLIKIVNRSLTATESSALESMASEHASYGSTRFHLQTLLPIDGPNHLAGIGHEAAVVAFAVSPTTEKTIVLAYSSESHNGPSYVAPHPGAATGVGGDLRDKAVKTANKPEIVCEARRQSHPLHNPHGDPIKRHTDETTNGIANNFWLIRGL